MTYFVVCVILMMYVVVVVVELPACFALSLAGSQTICRRKAMISAGSALISSSRLWTVKSCCS